MSQNYQRKVIRILAGKWASDYQGYQKSPKIAPLFIQNPKKGLEYFLRDSFARAGGEQAGYGEIAVDALNQCISTIEKFEDIIKKNDAPELVWNRFKDICSSQSKGVNKRVNEGVVKGLIRLTKGSKNYDYNLFRYIGEMARDSMTDAFIKLRNIKGIGDKIAPFLLRDLVCILDFEEKIPLHHRIFLQPIDRWVEETAICLWDDLITRRVPSWGIAIRIVDKCNDFGISGIRFNQGAWRFGTSEVKDTKKLCDSLSELSIKQVKT